jgi:RNA polymerase sigma-70 factor (ECF subfamily)
LHDVFDVSFGEVAEQLGRHEAACRQLAARARAHVRSARPRFDVAPDQGNTIVQTFMNALQTGNVAPLASALTADAVLYTDGGGERKAAVNPIRGRERVLRCKAGVLRKFAEPIAELRSTGCPVLS